MTTRLGKDLVGLEHLDAAQILSILDTAEPFKEVSERAIKKVPMLRGKTIVENEVYIGAPGERKRCR